MGRPSRRKNEPGILPAAQARLLDVDAEGKKSTPGRTSWVALAVVSTVVVPMDATTAPGLRRQGPVSKDRVRSVPGNGTAHA